ncbi:MAG: GAF domain-containing protein [Sphingomonas sp.]
MTGKPLAFFTPAAWPADEAERQAAVDSIDYAAAAADPRLAEIVARTAELFGTSSAVLSIVDRDRQNWVVRFGREETGTPRAISFCGHVVASPDAVLTVPDATADPRFAANPIVTAGNLRFYTGAPLLSEGMPLGALCTSDTVARPVIDPVAQAELARMADEAAAILSRYPRQRPETADED